MVLHRGAALVGYADLGVLPPEQRDDLPRGVSIVVPLDPMVVAGIEEGPTRAYHAEYERANALLNALAADAAALLEAEGHRAKSLVATDADFDPTTHSTRLPHKTVATRAGLGWIGKCALLVTETFGSAVRLTSVLTDAELPVGEPVDTSRCGACTACVEVCPGRAPSGGEWRAGIARDSFFNASSCREAARAMAAKVDIDETICGMCIAACPHTRSYVRPARE
jgi:epoxyqueuosine reductase QueG